MKKLLSILPKCFIVPLFLIGGVAAGLGAYTIYVSRMHMYATDDPAACVNCHVMAPYYQSWQHSSHAPHTDCNSCHVPHDSEISKYAFKAMDGLYHAAVFTFRAEPQVIRPRTASSSVIMANCITCHTQLNTEFVSTGMISFKEAEAGMGKACWDCHRNVPHTKISNTASSPNALAPMPSSPVPDWLKSKMNNSKNK
ncbi:MAG: cytochrome c nitrite reductase small subunit [Rikenellaceae bacterium]